MNLSVSAPAAVASSSRPWYLLPATMFDGLPYSCDGGSRLRLTKVPHLQRGLVPRCKYRAKALFLVSVPTRKRAQVMCHELIAVALSWNRRKKP